MDTRTADGKRPANGAEDERQDTPEGTPGASPGTTPGETEDHQGTGESQAAEADGRDEREDEAVDEEAVADADEADAEEAEAAGRTGMAAGAAAIVSVVLGVVSLTGGWLGTIASARASLIGQLETSQGAGVADQVQAIYGDSWQAAALVGGAFAAAGLLVGIGVVLRVAYWPARTGPVWVRSAAWAGVAVGLIGVLLALSKYTGLLLGVPSAG
ncbi:MULTISPECIES: hypothetical protein [Streptomyces]|uniref:Uncharacterized protein n=2 Tax=Streptomyces TaxID=1883 RepID=A0A8H9HT32_9ACTN|nr:MULTISPECIES: hypothetical protein [Streptomyces]NEE33369.1 hypothetical protein [Streptomyces sp. SID7982]NEE53682.1 hypothetical protein [Streptomyces sp. SID8455]MDQ0293020.1 hypothetical protein [Streptomyces sp. DSM 41037]PJM83620.1 hypothetical protein CH313_12715 [Streptomyces sp. TSRI0384-2]RPK84977.1 hypothetical protein EES47_22720 [Streptomyces sp. ADI98-12]